jgi:carboxylate-amine ligase
MLARLRPELEACGDWATVRELTEKALAEGSAAHRLRRIAAREDMLACVDELIALTRGPGDRAGLLHAAEAAPGGPGVRRDPMEPIGG